MDNVILRCLLLFQRNVSAMTHGRENRSIKSLNSRRLKLAVIYDVLGRLYDDLSLSITSRSGSYSDASAKSYRRRVNEWMDSDREEQ